MVNVFGKVNLIVSVFNNTIEPAQYLTKNRQGKKSFQRVGVTRNDGFDGEATAGWLYLGWRVIGTKVS